MDKLDDKFYVCTRQDEDSKVSTKIYQFEAFTPKIKAHKLNIVVLIHTHLITKRISRTILFSNDLTLDAATISQYYSLRFQIEFDFRDAKQFYGLSDFKNYRQTQVTNAVNLAFTMTVIGKLLLEKYKTKLNCPAMGILDLKTTFRVEKYAKILLNNNNQDSDEFLNNEILLNFVKLHAINIE